MQQNNAFRTISLILGFVLVTLSLFASSCATTQNQAASAEIGLKAEAVPEGLCLTFSNIPQETKRLFVHLQYFVDEEISFTNIVSSYSDLREGSLVQVKQTGKLILPVVEEGRKYRIAAAFQGENFEEIWVHTECIAGTGISFGKNITLNLNDTNTAVTLSSEPIFSSEVVFGEVKYNFGVTILYYQTETESGSIGVGSHHIPGIEGLTWVFDPEMTGNLREGGYLESGSYPAYVTARCNIIYDNITWSVEIAKTPEFTYSL